MAALLALTACGQEPAGKFNVVLISIDSLRADRTGPYGHRPEFAPALDVTPNLDRLAQSGTVFEDAWSSSSWTLASHMALMTGLTDRGHEVEFDDFALDPLRATLAEQFRAAGYATGGYFSGSFLEPQYGFGRGFQDYRSCMLSADDIAAEVKAEDAKRRQAGGRLTRRETEAISARLANGDVTSPRVNALARDFLNQKKDERFFLFLHYFDAHYDYLPQQQDPALAQLFDPDYGGAINGEDWFYDAAGQVMTWPSAQQPVGQRILGERDLRHVLALCDAEIHWVDKHVGEVLDQIAALGLEDETIVLVVSDHGDEFFEHGSIGHKSSLYAELCHIPLIVRVPGAGPKGQRVAELVRLYDLAPSLLDWCGLPPLAECQGASLRPFLEGQSDERTILHRIYARFNRDRFGGSNVREGFRSERFTVIRHLEALEQQINWQGMAFSAMLDPQFGRSFLVFDRRADPLEARPLAESDPRWREAVDAYCAAWNQCEAEVAVLPRSPLNDRRTGEKSDGERAALAAMGYVSTGVGTGDRHPELLPFPSPCLPPR